MTARKAGRLIGMTIIGVVAFGMALWVALGQPGIGLGSGSGTGYRDSDLDSNVPPGYTQCKGTCPGGYFDDNIELFLGTNPLDPCANTTTANDEADDKWPPDFNDDRTANVLDVIMAFGDRMDTCQGNPQYLRRSDLNADTCITQADADIFRPYLLTTCQELFPDPDNDAFPTMYEVAMGTDPADACPDNPNDAAWPPDINNDTTVNVLDALLFSPVLNQCWPSSLYNPRFDINADRCIDQTDMYIVGKYMLTNCTP
ncbi:MAG: dockerin type I domain-containing protein [Dehalococcoidia bacterium]|nr:dockerin type I domain-containing protein [Dehalococcoidia bacterium]